MPSFEELGLRDELVRTLEEEDVERPTALQAAVIPALRRGTNVVARASTGSGKTLTYLLGVLDRLEPIAAPADGPGGGDVEADGVALRVLILAPTLEESERIALTAYPYAQAVGCTVAVAGGAWGTSPASAEIVVAPAGDAMSAVRGSTLKLDAVETVVIDGGSTIHAVGGWDEVDTVLDLVPRDAQRVLVSATLAGEVQDLADRRVKRALQYPSEAALPEDRAAPVEGAINYVLVREGDKLAVLVRQLADPEKGDVPPVIFCRTDERAAVVAEQLATRGFLVGAVDDPEADVALVSSESTRDELLEEGGGTLGQTISYDVPADAETLTARHSGDDDAVVLAEPRELAHVREIAKMARLEASAIPAPDAAGGVTAARLEAFRDEIRRAIDQEDLAAQTLVLGPLLEEFSAVEVAAAAAALLRRRTPAPAPAAEVRAAPAAQAAATRAGAEPGPAPAAWSRLYVGVGSRDEVKPGDLVGALAGEANIPGSRIGKIEIRDNFSIVEVESGVADQVIRAVNGTTIKGRSARVDYDRGGDRGRKGAGPPRRQAPRPGGGGGGGTGGARRVVRRPPSEPRGKD